jgi:hypothetical protein
MSEWRCWVSEEMADEDGRDVESIDADEAAETYCEWLEGQGYFADGYSSPIVCVRDAAGDVVRVLVVPDFSVSFIGHKVTTP